MIVYAENSKEFAKNHQELIGEFSKIAESKIAMQKSIICLSMDTKQVKIKIKNTI